MKTWKHFWSTDFPDVFSSNDRFSCWYLPSLNSYLTLHSSCITCTHFWHLSLYKVSHIASPNPPRTLMAKNTEIVKMNRISSRPTPYLNLVAKKVLLLKKSFFYTFLCTKSLISFHLTYLGHWSLAKNIHDSQDEWNKPSPDPSPHSVTRKVFISHRLSPHLNLMARKMLTLHLSQYNEAPIIDLFSPSDTFLPFSFKRRQFPIRLAFCMIINRHRARLWRK